MELFPAGNTTIWREAKRKMAEAGESPMETESKPVQPAAVPVTPKQSGYELPWLGLLLLCSDNSDNVLKFGDAMCTSYVCLM